MRRLFAVLSLLVVAVSVAGQATQKDIVGAWRIKAMRVGGQEALDVMYQQMRLKVEKKGLEGQALEEALAEVDAEYAERKAFEKQAFRDSKMLFNADGTMHVDLPGEAPMQGTWWLSADGQRLYTRKDGQLKEQAAELLIDGIGPEELLLTEAAKKPEHALTVVLVRRKD